MANKFKILFIGDITDAKTRRWARYNIDLGHTVDFLTVNPGEMAGIKVFYLKTQKANASVWLKILSYLRFIWFEWKLINRGKYDIVHIHNPFKNYLAAFTGLHPRTIVSFWGKADIGVAKNTILKPHKEWKKMLLSKSAVITVHHQIIESKLKSLTSKLNYVEVLPMGIDSNRFSNLRRIGSGEGKTRFCYVSDLSQETGTDIAINAFIQYAASNPNSTLILVGSGEDDYVSKLKIMVRDSGLYRRVHFAETVTMAEIDAIFERSEVFLHPVREANVSLELLEALASGLPVITSELIGLTDVVIDEVSGLTVAGEDVKGFVTVMKRLAADEGLRTRMSKNAREFATKIYDFDIHAERMSSLYLELIKGNYKSSAKKRA